MPLDCLFEVDPNTRKRVSTVASFFKVGKDELKGSHCLLPISVGQFSYDLNVRPPQEGIKFAATIQLINRAQFGFCTILIDDTIQMATYRILNPEKSDEELFALTSSLGDKWLEEHRPFYSQLTMPYEIKRWDKDVAKHPVFPEGQKKIRALHEVDSSYRLAFNKNINQFLDRLEKRGVKFDRDVGYKQCLEYLLDENAGMGFVWPTWKPKFEIYPSGRNHSMSATYSQFIKDPGILSILSLRFKKRNVKEQEQQREDLASTSMRLLQ